jgi:hypothetical protein
LRRFLSAIPNSLLLARKIVLPNRKDPEKLTAFIRAARNPDSGV